MTPAELAPGMVVSFSGRLYLKGVVHPDAARGGGLIPGSYAWMRHHGRPFVVRLSPAWITTDTAFSAGSPMRLTGLAMIRDTSEEMILASGLVLGQARAGIHDELGM